MVLSAQNYFLPTTKILGFLLFAFFWWKCLALFTFLREYDLDVAIILSDMISLSSQK